MTVQLGAVTLDSRLLLRGLFESPLSQTMQVRLMSGALHVYSKGISSRNLTLTTDGPNNVKHGLFTRQQLEAIAAIRDAGIIVVLQHWGGLYNVMIPSDGVSVEPIIETATKSSGDKYSGTISLIEVV